ncbi:MAG: adenylate cyclase [Herbinix sp.]|jgi:CYTH domain-containing protein|nr:adenylate cyclase [Herbinix sp.]
MEIERKYLLNYMPGDLEQYHYKKIEQGYLCHNPIIRIRKSNDDFYLTYKSKFGLEQHNNNRALVNDEVELPLTKEAYELLTTKTEGNMVYKTRYLIPIKDGLTAELDVFEGILSGLIFTEVEFPDEAAADEFIPPSWIGRELTSDKRFSNYYLSTLSGIQELEDILSQ